MKPAAFPVLVLAGVMASCAARRVGTPSMLEGAGDHVYQVRHDGRVRQYIVHVPPGGTTAPRPVMLALHGGGGTAAQFKDEAGLDAVADRHDFLAVYPDGTGPLRDRLHTWNAGPDCCGYARDHDVDDVGFLVALLDDLEGHASIDRHRIYATGHSNGAMMAYRLGAEHADVVAAIVPVAGAMMVDRFRPSAPVAVLDIHSVDDPRALYEGGLGQPFPGTDSRVTHRAVMAGLEAWARANGCAAMPVTGETKLGQGANRGQTVTALAWTGCSPGGTVRHLRLTGVGHGWPGAPVRPAMRRLIGPGTTLISASDSAWAFASRFRR